ncbi:MAG: bifunctional methylenetetrahydrofolate dehydrogenase/methenyltetrahydrofolate cyclohydrolase FolD [Rhodospirillaceae bacterium]
MTSARIIDGKGYAASLRSRVTTATAELTAATGTVPGLAVILVGDDPASAIYVRNKERALESAGMRSFDHRLPAATTQADLLWLIHACNHDPAIHGILVQLPLPRQIDTMTILAAISPEKDADGFHITNVGMLAVGRPQVVPCTPLGCLMLLREVIGPALTGKRVLVIGRSTIVGRPMAQLLLNVDCTVTMAHSRTHNLREECLRAEILVAAMGKPELVRGDWIQPGAIVIDVGMNRLAPACGDSGPGRLVGDVCFTEAVEVAGAITPVPGGVGPMTIACLLLNTLAIACRQAGHPIPEEALP